MRKILVVFGTRPEAIKMAPVILELKKSEELECIVCITAQHREMLDQVLELFKINVDYDLDIMKPNQDLFDITAQCLLGLKKVIKNVTPDIVLVHGDTTTCMTAALAAFYLKIPVGHVEAGLRTYDLQAPFPEELNRTIVGKLASFHFAPTRAAKINLLNEGVNEKDIIVTGNTVIDALLDVTSKLSEIDKDQITKSIGTNLTELITNTNTRCILITGHRRENFGQGFVNFCNALKAIANENSNWLLIYPVHLNPNVQKPVNEILSGIENIKLIQPLDYLPFVWLLDQCDLVITDSGGIQEEAPSLGKPVLVTREVTERPEAVEAGTVRLVGTRAKDILSNTLEIMNNKDIYKEMSEKNNPYGDGLAASRITAFLSQL